MRALEETAAAFSSTTQAGEDDADALPLAPDVRLQHGDTVTFGDITLDVRTRRVTVGGRERDLSSREYVLLETFLRHPGHVLTREQLLSHVWGYDFDPASNVVDVYVRYLRRKIGADSIETVRGMGYVLDVPEDE